MNPDDQFLARAIELARIGSESGEGGPFGAVIVRDGKIIAEGWNRVVASHDPTAHATSSPTRAPTTRLPTSSAEPRKPTFQPASVTSSNTERACSTLKTGIPKIGL